MDGWMDGYSCPYSIEFEEKLTTSSGTYEQLLKLFVSLSLLQDADQGMVWDSQVI